jgi:hypothetical protein
MVERAAPDGTATDDHNAGMAGERIHEKCPLGCVSDGSADESSHADFHGEIVTGLWELTVMAGEAPVRTEDAIQVEVEHVAVGKDFCDRAWHRFRLFKSWRLMSCTVMGANP